MLIANIAAPLSFVKTNPRNPNITNTQRSNHIFHIPFKTIYIVINMVPLNNNFTFYDGFGFGDEDELWKGGALSCIQGRDDSYYAIVTANMAYDLILFLSAPPGNGIWLCKTFKPFHVSFVALCWCGICTQNYRAQNVVYTEAPSSTSSSWCCLNGYGCSVVFEHSIR